MLKKSANNFAARWDGYAVFAPALQKSYAEFTQKPKRQVREGKTPGGLSPRDLDFLNAKSALWHHPFALFSAGQYDASLIKPANAVSARDRSKTTIIGDSGGYQIGTGTLKEVQRWGNVRRPDEIMDLWRNASSREKIVRWLDAYCDYAMTIDIPLWTKTESKSKGTPFSRLSFEQDLQLTYENLKYITENSGRTGRKAKWLNVLHGLNDHEGTEAAWYARVKDFEFEGWAFASDTGVKGGITSLLRRLKRMQEDGQLDNKEWLHFLGLSKIKPAVILTAIQRGLQQSCAPSIQISYDSASASINGGQNEDAFVPKQFTNDEKTWTFSTAKFPNSEVIAQSKVTLPFPYLSSPLAKHVSLNDMNYQAGIQYRNKFDTLSSQLLINHNLYVSCQRLAEANDLIFHPTMQAHQSVPAKLLNAVGVVERVLVEEHWESLLSANADLLDSVGR